MLDLRVINILPSQPVSGVQQPQVANNQSSPGIAVNLPIGSVLSGFIINRDASGNPVLRTENGDVTFQSQLFLKIGTEISIRIENTGGHTSAHILTINGQPPEIGILQSAGGQEPEVIVSGHLSQNTATKTEAAAPTTRPVPNTITLSGTLLTPANADDGTPAAPSNSQLSLRVISLAAPTTLANTPAAAPVPTNPYSAYVRNIPGQPAPTQATATPAASVASAPAAIAPQVATPANIQSAATIPTPTPTPTTAAQPAATTAIPAANTAPTPPTSLPPAPIPQIGQAFTGVVINNEPTGEAIIQTPLGTIRLNANTPLPVGSQIQLELANITAPDALQSAAAAAATIPVPPALAAPTQLARSWPSMQNIFTLLIGQTADPDALSFLNNSMPNAGIASPAAASAPQAATQNLPSALMAFIGALRGGDFRSWIGQHNARWLEENGHGDVLKKASAEFTSLARQFTEPPSGQWQSLFFPVAVEGQIQQVRFFVKRDRKDKENEKGERKMEDDTRFVVEVDLTQLGSMQMDGFVRRREQDIQFDLIIRSHTALPQDVQKDILDIYNSTGELTGYKGGISFQAVRDFPVNPMEDIVSEHVKGVVA